METAIPSSPTGSRFGWPRPARVEEFRKLLGQSPSATARVVFQGKTIDIPIIRVAIELPKYRLANGRTSSLQAEYLAKDPALRQDLFTGDPELWDAQEAQHGLLLQYADQSNLQSFFADAANKQVEPLLLDENGFVVNGNRRLSVWRELLFQSPAKFGHYRHVDVAVLPHATERDIDRLEVKLQIEEDIQAEYIWHAHANMMLAQQRRDGFSNKELAELHRMKEKEVQELLDMRSYAEEYLRSRNKSNMWSLVGDEYAFRKIVTSRPRLSGVGSQELFKQAAYVLIDKPEDAGGRLYEVIPAIMESIEQVRDKLQVEFAVKPAAADTSLENLFGSETTGKDARIDLPLASEIQKPENVGKAREIIVEVIESQRQLKRDAKSAGYLLDCCAKAQSFLAAAIKDGLRPESRLAGVDKQLAAIEGQLARIRTYLQAHA